MCIRDRGKLKRLYYQLLRKGRRVCRRFARELAVAQEALSQRELRPSQRLLAGEVLELIGEDLQAISTFSDGFPLRSQHLHPGAAFSLTIAGP